jgi:predicted P-loop ATPase
MSSRNVVSIAERAEQESAKLGPGNLIVDEKGRIQPCDYNAHELLAAEARYAELHFDEFLCRTRIGDRDWTDHDEREALFWLQSTHGVPRFSLAHARNATMAIAASRRRDSLREFVEALPAWDGTPRIEHAFTDAWGAPDNVLVRASSRNLFVAMIARALKPGVQVDTVWCFEGPQGTFKSRSLRELGGTFHAEITAPIGTADFMRELRGLWLAEFAELETFRGR